MKRNQLKEKLAEQGKALGCWLFINHPVVAEIVGLAGFDCVMIDHEHGPGDFQAALSLMQAVRAAGDTTCLMRVPSNDASYIKRALDIGAQGIMVPMVETPDQAEAVVSACRYPPHGIRGCASSLVRATDYGLDEAAYLEAIDDELLVICQIETQAGIDNVEAIAAVEGVDMLFVGPADLSASLGYLHNRRDPEFIAALDALLARIRAAGAWAGTVPRADASAHDLLKDDYNLVVGGSDIGLLRDSACAYVKSGGDNPGF